MHSRMITSYHVFGCPSALHGFVHFLDTTGPRLSKVGSAYFVHISDVHVYFSPEFFGTFELRTMVLAITFPALACQPHHHVAHNLGACGRTRNGENIGWSGHATVDACEILQQLIDGLSHYL